MAKMPLADIDELSESDPKIPLATINVTSKQFLTHVIGYFLLQSWIDGYVCK